MAWARRDFLWALLIVPVPFASLVYGLSEADVLGWRNPHAFKQMMEVAHPALLAASLLFSLESWRSTRDASFAALAALSFSFLGRELAGQGSSIALSVALTGIVAYTIRRPERVTSLLRSRWATSCLGLCAVCYFASQLLDRGVVKRIGWWITGESGWLPPHASNLEEALETLGGLFVLGAAAALRVESGVESASARGSALSAPSPSRAGRPPRSGRRGPEG